MLTLKRRVQAPTLFHLAPVILTLNIDLYGVHIFNVMITPLSGLTFQSQAYFSVTYFFEKDVAIPVEPDKILCVRESVPNMKGDHDSQDW